MTFLLFPFVQACTVSPVPPVNIAIRFTYILQDWQQYSWPQQPPGWTLKSPSRENCDTYSPFVPFPDFDALLGGEVGGVEFGKLPFGACEEPIRWDDRNSASLFLPVSVRLLCYDPANCFPAASFILPPRGLVSPKAWWWIMMFTGKKCSSAI